MEKTIREWIRNTTIYVNQDFIFLETRSGYIMAAADPEGSWTYLKLDITDTQLGEELLKALALSRKFTREEYKTYPWCNMIAIGERYTQWIAETMQLYGYKNKRKMFSQMSLCHATVYEDGQLVIRPGHHEKLEAWGAVRRPDQNVELPYPSPPEEVGKALRLALSRCTSVVSK